MRESRLLQPFPDLLVGIESSDDAAVYRLNESQAIVATTDFFMPIVDDPYDFGRAAAANALSDIYAMGGQPFLALAILGVPVGKLPVEAVQRIVAGGQSICATAGIPIAGGHSIDAPEPIYGLVGLGLVHPDRIRRNSDAQAGDVLILSKPLGIGVMSAALKKGQLGEEDYSRMVASMTQLNTPGPSLAAMDAVHGMTDVTGFGLLGHLNEMCVGAGLAARIRFADVPVFPNTARLMEQGFVTGASERNWTACASAVTLPAAYEGWQRKLLTDPQTSGGLLVSCSAHAADEVLNLLRKAGFGYAAVIGSMVAGDPAIEVV